MDRTEVLRQANEIITKDRQATHGKPEDNFRIIGQFWSTYLNHEVKPTDVAMMMAMLKIARFRNAPWHLDNAMDLAGYAAIAGELGASAVKPTGSAVQ